MTTTGSTPIPIPLHDAHNRQHQHGYAVPLNDQRTTTTTKDPNAMRLRHSSSQEYLLSRSLGADAEFLPAAAKFHRHISADLAKVSYSGYLLKRSNQPHHMVADTINGNVLPHDGVVPLNSSGTTTPQRINTAQEQMAQMRMPSSLNDDNDTATDPLANMDMDMGMDMDDGDQFAMMDGPPSPQHEDYGGTAQNVAAWGDGLNTPNEQNRTMQDYLNNALDAPVVTPSPAGDEHRHHQNGGRTRGTNHNQDRATDGDVHSAEKQSERVKADAHVEKPEGAESSAKAPKNPIESGMELVAGLFGFGSAAKPAPKMATKPKEDEANNRHANMTTASAAHAASSASGTATAATVAVAAAQPPVVPPGRTMPIAINSPDAQSPHAHDSFRPAFHKRQSAPMTMESFDTATSATSAANISNGASTPTDSRSYSSHHSSNRKPPSDYVDPKDNHVWRAKYCILQDGILYFYRNPTDANCVEAMEERNQEGTVTPRQRKQATIHDLAKSPMPRRYHDSLNSPNRSSTIASALLGITGTPQNKTRAQTGHIWEKRVYLDAIGAVRSAESAYGSNCFELVAVPKQDDNGDSDSDSGGDDRDGNRNISDAAANEQPNDLDGRNKLVLQARHSDDMNEWLFQFHRSLASLIINLMSVTRTSVISDDTATLDASNPMSGRYSTLGLQRIPQPNICQQPNASSADESHRGPHLLHGNRSRICDHNQHHEQQQDQEEPIRRQPLQEQQQQQPLARSFNTSYLMPSPGLMHGHGHGKNNWHRSKSSPKNDNEKDKETGFGASSNTSSGVIGSRPYVMGNAPSLSSFMGAQITTSKSNDSQQRSNGIGASLQSRLLPPSSALVSNAPTGLFPPVASMRNESPSILNASSAASQASGPQGTSSIFARLNQPKTASVTGRHGTTNNEGNQPSKPGRTGIRDNPFAKDKSKASKGKYIPPGARKAASQKYVPPSMRNKGGGKGPSSLSLAERAKQSDAQGIQQSTPSEAATGLGLTNPPDRLDIIDKWTGSEIRGGCANPEVVTGSILDDVYKPRKTSKLGRVSTEAFGCYGGGDVERAPGDIAGSAQSTTADISTSAKNSTSSLQFEVGAISECGPFKPSNEDSYFINNDLLAAFQKMSRDEGGETKTGSKASGSSQVSWDTLQVRHKPSVFAIFDGHCGDEAARFAVEKMTRFLFEETKDNVKASSVHGDGSQGSRHRGAGDVADEMAPSNENEIEPSVTATATTTATATPQPSKKSFRASDVQRMLNDAIVKMDDVFCRTCSEDGRDWESGATALVAILADNNLTISNLGDSRGVICRSIPDAQKRDDAHSEWNELDVVIDDYGRRRSDDIGGGSNSGNGNSRGDAVRMCMWKEITPVHSPLRDDEKKRIEAANGWVVTESEIFVEQIRRMDLEDRDVMDILYRCLNSPLDAVKPSASSTSGSGPACSTTSGTAASSESSRSTSRSSTQRSAAPHRIMVTSRVCSELAVSRAIGDRDFKAQYNSASADQSADGGAAVTTGSSDGAQAPSDRTDGSNDDSSATVKQDAAEEQQAKLAAGEGWWDCIIPLPYPDGHSQRFKGDLIANTPESLQFEVGMEGVSEEFVVLACDGLWDVMDADDAVRVTRDLLFRQKWTAKKAAARLTELAIHLGSSDNITVIVLRLFYENDDKAATGGDREAKPN